MSFILDALQKSERERHAGQAPALDEALTRPLPELRRGRREAETALVIRTVLVVSAVFLIAGLTWWLLSRTASAPAPVAGPAGPVAVAEPAPSLPEPAPAPTPALRIDPERLQAPVAAPDLGPEAASLDELLDESEPATRRAPPTDAYVQPEDTTAKADAAVAGAGPAEEPAAAASTPPPKPPGEVRRLKDMPPSFRGEFPALSVQVHVYDANPLRRFVLVNGKKYRETDTLVEGPQVIEIVEHGIVLEQRGTRVLLEMPR